MLLVVIILFKKFLNLIFLLVFMSVFSVIIEFGRYGNRWIYGEKIK